MLEKAAPKEFEESLVTLELIINYIYQAIDLLRRSVEGKLSLKDKDNKFVRIVLTHYVVNNLAALFDEDRKANSLPQIAKRFKKCFPDNFFVEYLNVIQSFRTEHARDLERIVKNRNLSTAHLDNGVREQLGWSPQIAENIDDILGMQSSVAKNHSLKFITPFQVFDLSIIQEISRLKSILNQLYLKLFISKRG